MADHITVDEACEGVDATATNGPLRNLGLVRDGIAAAKPAVAAGLNIAERSSDFGFAVARASVSGSFYAASWLVGDSIANATSAPIHSVLNVAQTITKHSLHASRGVSELSLSASDAAIEFTGAKKGEAIKMLHAHVEAQTGQDGHQVKEAVLGICVLLVELGGQLSVTDPALLLRGARRLALLHEQERNMRMAERCALDRAGSIVLPKCSELKQLSRLMRFSAAAYGYQACHVMGISTEGLLNFSDRAMIQSLTGVQNSDILRMVTDTEMYCPGHFVAVDRKEHKVVIAIRGTLSLQDALVDLVCKSVEFVSIHDNDNTLIGQAHHGFLKSAQRLANDLHEIIATALHQNDGYELVITGHSLGAGVATLLGLLWSQLPEFRARNIHVFAFAAPCSVCADISQAPFTRRHVSSIVTGDDIVSRLGLTTFKELQNSMLELAKTPPDHPTVRERARVPRELPQEDKLFCAGRVWWLNSPEYEPYPIVEINPVEELSSIELFADVFAVHMPNSYMKTLEGMDENCL